MACILVLLASHLIISGRAGLPSATKKMRGMTSAALEKVEVIRRRRDAEAWALQVCERGTGFCSRV